MKPEIPNDPDRARHQTLRDWKVDASLPPRFDEGVWKKIERAESVGTVNLWAVLRIRLAEAFARPSLAVSYVVVLLLVGSAAGYWQGQIASQRADEKFSAQYVAAVDPYQRLPR